MAVLDAEIADGGVGTDDGEQTLVVVGGTELGGEVGDNMISTVEMAKEDFLPGNGDGHPRCVVAEVKVFVQQEVLVGIARIAIGEDYTAGFGATVDTSRNFG